VEKVENREVAGTKNREVAGTDVIIREDE